MVRFIGARITIWLLIPVLVGLAAFLFASGIVSSQWAIWLRSVPVVEFPAVIDLGQHEQGEVVNSRFVIANRGRGELVIDRIRSTCACAGLEREVNGKFVRLETLRLGPREEAELIMRISVRGPAGASIRNLVVFRTNDQRRPEGVIEAVISKVTGGINTTPMSVVFGSVARGDEVRQIVDIFDGAAQPRTISRIESSNPRLATVRLLPQEKDAGKKEKSSLGILLARVEIIINTKEPARIDESLLVYLTGEERAFCRTQITGRIANIVEAMPPSLVLPQHSEQRLLNSGCCLCRSTKGRPLTLAVDFVPPSFKVDVSPVEGSPHMQLVRIEYVPYSREKLSTESSRPIVRLRATLGDKVTLLEIPVIIRTEGGS